MKIAGSGSIFTLPTPGELFTPGRNNRGERRRLLNHRASRKKSFFAANQLAQISRETIQRFAALASSPEIFESTSVIAWFANAATPIAALLLQGAVVRRLFNVLHQAKQLPLSIGILSASQRKAIHSLVVPQLASRRAGG